MLSDHGTIGGYPKIGVVISADYDKLVQLPPGSKIKFKEIELSEAEMLFKLYKMETQNLLLQIQDNESELSNIFSEQALCAKKVAVKNSS